ncbi:MAG: N-acetylglucosamine kinase [Ktedonobacterales bacterium]
MRYVVGVDGGGTKTTAAVVGEDLQVMARCITGSTNARSVGWETASANLADVIAESLEYARLPLEAVVGVGLCLAGFDTDLDLAVPNQALNLLGYTGVAVLENDVLGAWAGATQMQPGIVVIAGTGSTALGMNQHGQLRRTDGWDYILGDAGSGYDIGRNGIRLAMKSFDGRAAPTLLTDALKATYGVDTAEEMRRLVDSGPFGKMEIAVFAQAVAQAADAGDGASRSILAQAGKDLAEQALAVAYALRMEEEEFLIASVGSVFRADRWVVEPFRRFVQQQVPHPVFCAPLHPPEMGAAILALRRLESGDFGSWTLGTGRQRIVRTGKQLYE